MKNDFVRTPKEVTEALLRYESFDGDILEPSPTTNYLS